MTTEKVETKRCRRCETERPLSDFVGQSATHEGHGKSCRRCTDTYRIGFDAGNIHGQRKALARVLADLEMGWR